MNGNWADTSVSYDYIFTGDAVNLISAQTSNNYTDTPFLITGQTASRLSELRSYGPQKYKQTLILSILKPRYLSTNCYQHHLLFQEKVCHFPNHLVFPNM